jgi:hypothetical protein
MSIKWWLMFSPSCHGSRAVYASKIVLTLRLVVDFSGEGMKYSAEREGFEPSVAPKATTVFETAPIVHSGTSPTGRHPLYSKMVGVDTSQKIAPSELEGGQSLGIV